MRIRSIFLSLGRLLRNARYILLAHSVGTKNASAVPPVGMLPVHVLGVLISFAASAAPALAGWLVAPPETVIIGSEVQVTAQGVLSASSRYLNLWVQAPDGAWTGSCLTTYEYGQSAQEWKGSSVRALTTPGTWHWEVFAASTHGALAGTSPTGTLVCSGVTTVPARIPTTFSFSNLEFHYDGSVKIATVTVNPAEACYVADLTKGPEIGSYVVTATAQGAYVGTGSASLVIKECAAEPDHTTSAVVGGVTGELSVGNTGAATYSFPLPSPSGRGGSTPTLGLSYASQNRNGPLGGGWVLAYGPSVISRGRTILARDRFVHAADGSVNDRLYLDGKLLVLVSGATSGPDAYWRVGNVYRTEVDSFVKVTALGHNGALTSDIPISGPSSGTKIEAFKVEWKDGSVSYFGRIDDTADDALSCYYSQGNLFYDYAIKRMIDVVGNVAEFYYTQYQNQEFNYITNTTGRPTGERLLAAINYGGNVSERIPHRFGVRFTYSPRPGFPLQGELRPDRMKGYYAGRDIELLRRLVQIETGTLNGDFFEPSMRHTLLYGTSPATSRSRLAEIRRSVKGDTEGGWVNVPGVNFRYNDSGGLQVPMPVNVPNSLIDPLRDPALASQVVTGDFNGDGIPDKYFQGKVYLGNSSGFANGVAWLTPAPYAFLRSGDVDGDGYCDLIWVDTVAVYAARSTGAGFVPFAGADYYVQSLGEAVFGNFGDYWAAAASRVSVGDFNGDGRTDVLVHCSYNGAPPQTAGLYVLRSTGTGFAPAEKWGDVNITDRLYIETSTSFPTDWSGIHHVPSITAIEPIVCDFNGDGADDYAYVARNVTWFDQSQQALFEAELRVGLTGNWAGGGGIGFASVRSQQRYVSYQGVSAADAPLLKVWVGDCNGDGYKDLLVLGEQSDGQGGRAGKFYLYPCRGTYFGDPIPDLLSISDTNLDLTVEYQSDQYFYPKETPLVQTGGMFLQDVNGDGRADFVVGRGERGGWTVRYANADGFAGAEQLWDWHEGALSQLGTPFPCSSVDPGITVEPIDLDADGAVDWILSGYNGYILTHGAGARADLLEGVTDGLGRKTAIAYKSTGDASVYTPGLARLSYPIRENRSPQMVVSDVWKDTGSIDPADRAHFTYQYSGRYLDLSGRGDLGFHSFVTLDRQTNLFKYQFLAQSFPMTGLTAREQTYRYWEEGGNVKFRLVNSHDNTVVFDEVVKSDSDSTPWGTVYPFISQAVEYRWEDSNAAHFSWSRSTATPTAADVRSSSELLFTQARPSGAHIAISATSLFDNQTAVQTTIPGTYAASDRAKSATDRTLDWASSGINAVTGSTSYSNFHSLFSTGYRKITNGNLKQLSTNFGDGFTESVATNYYPPSEAGGLTGLVKDVTTTVGAPAPYNTDADTKAPIKRYTYWLKGSTQTPLVATKTVDADGTALDLTTTYTRDALGRITATTVAGYNPNSNSPVLGSTTNDAHIQHVGTFTANRTTAFDAKWDLPTIVQNADGYGHTTTTAYHPFLGLPTSVSGPNNDTVTTTYDALGRKLTVTDVIKGLSTTTTYAWDPSQTVAPPSGITGIGPGAPITGVSAITATSVYAIRTTATVQPPVTAYYDRLGRVIRTIKEGFAGQQTYTDTVYNTLGQTIAVSLPYDPTDSATGPLWTTTTYDALGRVATITAPNGTVTTNTYNGRCTTVTVKAADREAQSNTTYVDAKGRTIKVWNADNNPGSLDPSIGSTTTASIEYKLDGFGRMRSTILKDQTQRITATYDALGRQTALNDPDKGNWSYVNNALGQVVRQTDAKGTVTRSTFDRLGRPLSRKTTETAGPIETADWYYYDFATDATRHTVGHIVGSTDRGWIGAPQREMAFTDPNGTPGYVDAGSASVHYYDEKGRPSLNLSSVDSKYFYTCLAYDAYSRPSSVRYFWRPSGDEGANTPYYWNDWGYTYTYDAKSYLLLMADSAGRTWWQADTVSGYDHLDRPVLVRKGAGHWTSRVYRATDGLLSAIKTGPSAGTSAVQNLAFDYDGLGNLKSRTGAETEKLEYDVLNRLRKATIGTTSVATFYDANGNITAKQGVDGVTSGSYTYDPNKPHAVTAAFGYTMTYDANGNLLTRTGGGHTWSTKWAGFDKPRWLADTTAAGTKGSEFTYNANRSRVVHLEFDAMSNGAPSHYVRKKVYGLGPQLEADYANTASTGTPVWKLDKLRLYVPGPEGIVGAMEFNPRKPLDQAQSALVYHYDHLGSIERITPYGSTSVAYALDGAGKPSRYSYDAWGQRRNADTWSGKPTTTADGGADDAACRGFTGHEMLDDIGLVHMNGRIYDPLLGRFLSADVLVEAPGDLQAYNRYSYARNNPLTLTDPSGFMTIDEHRKKIEELRAQQKTLMAAWVKQQGGAGKALVKALFGISTFSKEGKAHHAQMRSLDQAIGDHSGAIQAIKWSAGFHNFMVETAASYQGNPSVLNARVDAAKIDDEAADGEGGIPHQTILKNGGMAAAVVQMHAAQGTGTLLGALGEAQVLSRELNPITQAGSIGPRTIPLGMKTGQLEAAFSRFKAAAGVDDAVIGIRGSAVTGISRTRGPISAPADYDFFIVSDKLFQQGVAAGARPVDGALRVSATKRFFPAIHEVEGELSTSLGLKSTARIFSREGFQAEQTGAEILSK